MKPLVSILIPAYNAEPWIADTIRSALRQSWPLKEIIIVDDGSTDNTFAVAQQFAGAEVAVVTQKNSGAAAARNKAFSLCKGDYIQWLDADDLLEADKIEKQLMMAEKSFSDRMLFSSGWGYFSYRPRKTKFVPTLLWENLSPLEWLLRKWENNLHMQTATWLVSRALTEQAGPWDSRLLGDDDGEYFFRVIKKGDGIRFVSETGVFYRVSGAGRLSYIGRSDKKMNAQFLGMKMQIGYLRSMMDDERVRAACITYLQTWLINFYPNRMDIFEEAQRLANDLGGQLHLPDLSWKYRWIQKTLGWSAARRVQINYNEWKLSALRSWDKAMFHLEERRADI
jgi:glycosyltransferase involved in cell wall biosynthesis